MFKTSPPTGNLRFFSLFFPISLRSRRSSQLLVLFTGPHAPFRGRIIEGLPRIFRPLLFCTWESANAKKTPHQRVPSFEGLWRLFTSTSFFGITPFLHLRRHFNDPFLRTAFWYRPSTRRRSTPPSFSPTQIPPPLSDVRTFFRLFLIRSLFSRAHRSRQFRR